jgi:hypothetical protein
MDGAKKHESTFLAFSLELREMMGMLGMSFGPGHPFDCQ